MGRIFTHAFAISNMFTILIWEVDWHGYFRLGTASLVWRFPVVLIKTQNCPLEIGQYKPTHTQTHTHLYSCLLPIKVVNMNMFVFVWVFKRECAFLTKLSGKTQSLNKCKARTHNHTQPPNVDIFCVQWLQSDLGYSATSGLAPIRISDLAGYGS